MEKLKKNTEAVPGAISNEDAPSRVQDKHAGGRPPKYSSPEELQTQVNDYFESCWVDKITEQTDKDGGCTMSTVRYQQRPYTVAGLALHLGFNSRQSLLNYEARQEFLDIIKKSKLKIEMNVEETCLWGKNPGGSIFWLKNHSGYVDKQEHDLNHKFLLEDIVGGEE